MASLQFTIEINAPKQKVWEVMFSDQTYRQWTSAFMPGSYYEGSWTKGSAIRFVAADEDGKLNGMASRIAENSPHEFLSIEHVGIVTNGHNDTSSDEAKQWAGSHENYTFSEKNGVTTIRVDLESNTAPQDMLDMMAESWPVALKKLKELAEA
jgi:uncharacterized protein YndB with AHSA1/START domain